MPDSVILSGYLIGLLPNYFQAMKVLSGLFCVLILLAGCGQPGPLYLPKDQPTIYAEPPPAPKTQAAPDSKDTRQATEMLEPSPTDQPPQQQ